MALAAIRILLLADTHIGLDDPARPRVLRRRRGPDFQANFERALEPARRGEVDAVVHGGDLLYRSRVPATLVARAVAPLAAVAARGVPVFLVPGNHERGRIPFPLLARCPGLHVFDRPRTYEVEIRGVRTAFAGFPFVRRVRQAPFARSVAETGIGAVAADLRLLCIHQAVEGARVGAHDFTFRRGPDVVPAGELPRGVAAVLSGHIHRAQVLGRDLGGRPLAAPVIYPGSIERTSFAERRETKGFQWLGFAPGPDGGRLASRRFVPLPARPMEVLRVDATGLGTASLARLLRRRFARLHRDAVVRVEWRGPVETDATHALTAAALRRLAPPTMNVELARPVPRRQGVPV